MEARRMLAMVVREGISPDCIRRSSQQKLNGSRRDWNITKGEKLAEFGTITWSRALADVHLEDAETYCADIEAWAKSILEDTDFLAND